MKRPNKLIIFVWAILFLVLAMVVSIDRGVATPVEIAEVGCFCAMAIGFALRGLTWQAREGAFVSACRISYFNGRYPAGRHPRLRAYTMWRWSTVRISPRGRTCAGPYSSTLRLTTIEPGGTVPTATSVRWPWKTKRSLNNLSAVPGQDQRDR